VARNNLFSSDNWPNEPAGFTVIRDYGFDDVLPVGQSVPVGSGGWSINNAGGNATRVSDANAPMSASNVGQWKYPIGFGEGGAPATMWTQTSGRELYIGFIWKADSPFQPHSSGVNKIIFQWTATSDLTYMRMHGLSEPYSIVLGDAPIGHGDNMWPNKTQTNIFLDTWYRIEWYQKMSTTAISEDGIIRIWVSKWNGSSWDAPVLNTEYTNLNFYKFANPSEASSDFGEFQFSPTYGGNSPPPPELKEQEDYFWFDHVHISIPGGGASVSDGFNRADENPIASPWVAVENTVRLYANATIGGGYAIRNVARYSGAGLAADQESQVVLVGTPTSHGERYLGPCARIANNAASYYAFYTDDTESVLLKVVAGTPTVLASGGNPGDDGDVLRIRVVGSTITGYINDVLQLTTADGEITSGDPGLLMHSNYPTLLDDFFAQEVE
jgi:hypothetical protein